ncbi:sensor histidine kinase [Leptothoe sp. PORK10 BA2]|uniref:sensor histidine kinase n=1 Tax=Leptothoe sp. PORK10 BA2 TaxID=3110254 RepID=UPI002B20E799|nr:ATP-binding protein [Leptothoe sp. PORK10 BA2]MEA5467072.1 ATP-binding protein [Leptothoe sp. PORK10 BA2]
MKGQLGQRIMALAKSKEFSELVQFSDQIDRIATVIDQETRAAENQLQKAETLRMQIILASLIASVMTAILLAIVTGRSIAYPLEALTQVAQQVTRDANTNLRAPVSSRDEVGTLAHALNQLLEWVETYTRDLKDTQLNLVQAEKMSALGKMVAGVAHEINNPVNFIHGNLTYMQEYAHNLLGFVTLYQESYPDPTPAIQAQTEAIDMEFIQTDLPKLLNSMKMGTDRIRQIVLSLRNFSRLDEANFKDVDIHEGIDSTLLILRHRLKDKPEHPAIQVIRDYGNLPLVECYPGQLNQAFMNILSNAIDAIEEVNAERTDEEVKENPSQIVIQTSMIDSNWIKILISDNGIGMPESVRSRIFDPFFTTKSVGKGTGIGMSISYQIVTEQHGGKLTCCSILGEGTDFVIQIPIQQQIREAA